MPAPLPNNAVQEQATAAQPGAEHPGEVTPLAYTIVDSENEFFSRLKLAGLNTLRTIRLDIKGHFERADPQSPAPRQMVMTFHFDAHFVAATALRYRAVLGPFLPKRIRQMGKMVRSKRGDPRGLAVSKGIARRSKIFLLRLADLRVGLYPVEGETNTWDVVYPAPAGYVPVLKTDQQTKHQDRQERGKAARAQRMMKRAQKLAQAQHLAAQPKKPAPARNAEAVEHELTAQLLKIASSFSKAGTNLPGSQ